MSVRLAFSELRIRLDPGEGYITPTELLPHDGSTAGIDQGLHCCLLVWADVTRQHE